MSEIEIFYEGQLGTRCVHKETKDVVKTDAPKDNMGQGKHICPTDLLATALGACVLTLMGIAANKYKVDLKGVRLVISKEMVVAPVRRVGKLVCDIYCPMILDSEVTKGIEYAGSHCPVHESLHPDIIQEFRFHWGAP